MTRNQLHGKKFEDLIKACGLFPGSADGGRSVTASFDIEARFDKRRGLPTSIKSTASEVIGLSDARRFWSVNEDYRMIVGPFEQRVGIKKFAKIHEFLLDQEILQSLRGDVSLAEVQAFHEGLALKVFVAGTHDKARRWAKGQNKIFASRNCAIVLNPKIDSKTQRRLQCSVSLRILIKYCAGKGLHIVHDEWIGDLRLPLELNSSAREFDVA